MKLASSSSVNSSGAKNSSAPGDDEVSKMLQDVKVSSPHGGGGECTSVVSVSGEYDLSSTMGGFNVNNAKKVQAVCFTNSSIRTSCLGFIGSRKQVFCLKPKRDCDILSHATSKFQPKLNHHYIAKSQLKDSAWCGFCVSSSSLREILPDLEVNVNRSHTLTEWKAYFENANSILDATETSELSRAISFMTKPVTRSNLRTPSTKYRSTRAGLTYDSDDSPSLPKFKTEEVHLESSISNDDVLEWSSVLPVSLSTYLKAIRSDVQMLFDENLASKQNVPTFMEHVSKDLTDVVSSITGLQQSIGTDHQGSYQDLWSAISEFDQVLNGIDLKNVEELVTSASVDVTMLKEQLNQKTAHWLALGKNWLPLISKNQTEIEILKSKITTQLSTPRESSSPQNLDFILGNPTLSFAPDSHQVNHNSTNQQSNSSFASTNMVMSHINKLESKIQQLESQLKEVSTSTSQSSSTKHSPGTNQPSNSLGFAGVSYKQYYFASPFEVRSWMKDTMTHPSHGLFVDLVSFSEFFGRDSYTERGQTLNELYMTNKIGYQTMADAVVAASFSNVLPGAYARVPSSASSSSTSSCDMASQKELPGLSSYDKWDGQDGRTGRRWWIIDETRKTEQQLDGWIRSQLHGPAQLLAKDLLMDSYTMSDALYTFISTSFADTRSSNKFSDEQCWVLTSSFVKRIFQELGYVRVMARDSANISDPWTTAATFLFATLKAHVIMQEFMRLSIKDHPSISSEMVKFVCYSQPAQGASTLVTRLSAVEALQRSDQSMISKLDGRIKKVESWKPDTDKLLKKLKEKAGI